MEHYVPEVEPGQGGWCSGRSGNGSIPVTARLSGMAPLSHSLLQPSAIQRGTGVTRQIGCNPLSLPYRPITPVVAGRPLTVRHDRELRGALVTGHCSRRERLAC
jgi:hypothetical protein